MRCGLVAFAAVALLPAVSTHGSGQTAPQAPAAAEQARLTPASIALLGNRLDSQALARLRSAISQQDARARTIAARVAGVAKAADLAADLAAALAQETDERAAAEQVRALLVIDTPYARTAAERHLAQARAPAVSVYLHWLLRTRPERAADGVDRALQPIARDDVHVLTDVVAKAVIELPTVRNQVLAAWLNKATGSAWRRVLDVLPVDAGSPPVALLRKALESDDPLVRQETVWWMVTRIARGGSVETAALDAAADGGAHLQPSNAAATWETFGREVIARRHRKSTAIDRAELLEREAKRHRPDARALALMPPPPRQPLPVGGGEIEPPRQIRGVQPEYPEAARQKGIQGLVIVEAIISASGCVTSIEVLRGVHPLLDAAAVKAISGWRYTPTLLDGDPMAVIMTVAANFELK